MMTIATMKFLIADAANPYGIQSISQRAAVAYGTKEFFLYVLIGVAGIGAFISALGVVLIYMERKVAAHFQCRLGPMRVGWHGILQSVADGLKLINKEGIEPKNVDLLLFLGAPMLNIVGAVLLIAIIPMSPIVQVIDVNIGVVYIAAISGLGVVGILLAGWSSNNKWSLLGAMRAGAQMISYELSVTLAVLIIVMFSGSLKLSEIVMSQQDGWWIWRGHFITFIAFIIFVIASTAELNRTPFDLAEGESELTAGYHTEYSGIRFSFFFLAEFAHVFIFASLASVFFFGGWMPFHISGLDGFNSIMDMIPGGIWFFLKCFFFIFLQMWIRWTFPRLRIDQLIKLEWKILLPIGFVNLILAACIILFKFYFFPGVN